MEDVNLVENSLLEKIQNLMERKPGHCDVAFFSVGKEKKIVKAMKLILKASSPFLERKFEEMWDLAVIPDGDGIPLPDFEPPTAFELFVKLTSLDMWSSEHLQTLQPTQILNLLSICRSFEMKKAAENLEKLSKTFMQSFGEYKETEDFLQLSQPNLKYFLVSNDIGVKELDIFHCAIRWAEFQCQEMKVEPSQENIRKVLGDCLFEIRFPIMSCIEFTKALDSKDILTAEETIGIYKFIGLEPNKKSEFDTKKLPFKTTPRKTTQALESQPNPSTNNNSVAPIPIGISTLSLTRDLQIVENPPFVCDGSQNYHYFACEKNITVFGLGFLGPIENDGFYDVKVHIEGRSGIVYDSGLLEKHIFAQTGTKFYFVFDAPIDFEEGQINSWTEHYKISYYLKGPHTSSALKVSSYTSSIQQEGDTKFRLMRRSNQLAEILFKLKDLPEPAAKVQSSFSPLKPVKPLSDENSVTTRPVSDATSTLSHLNCVRWNDSTETNAGADTKDKAHNLTNYVTTRSKTKAKATLIPIEQRNSQVKKRKAVVDIESESSSEEDNTTMDSKKRPTVTHQPSCKINPGLEKAKVEFESGCIPVKAEPDE